MLGGDTGDRFISLRGYPEFDDTFLLLMNAHDHEVQFTLPTVPSFAGWKLLVDTAHPSPIPADTRFLREATFGLRGRTLALLLAE
jgi:glycogen operon protein